MVTSIQPQHSSKPPFSTCSVPIHINKLQSIVEPGTYISFYYNSSLCYGQLISSYDQDDVSMCVINKYNTCEDILAQLNDQCPSPITDRFIGVKELFQTCTFIDSFTDILVGILFVFCMEHFIG